MVTSGAAPPAAPRADDASPAHDLALLAAAIERFDDVAANAVFDELLARYTVRTVLSSVVVPYLADLGDRWARGEATIAQEHFASNMLRGRLLGLGRVWDAGVGPRALLACPSGEQHQPRPDLLRDRPARPRMADHLPRRGRPTPRVCRNPSASARTGHHVSSCDRQGEDARG